MEISRETWENNINEIVDIFQIKFLGNLVETKN